LLYVRGSVASLGADCEQQQMTEADRAHVAALLAAADVEADASQFRRYGSARRLYTFHVDNAGAY
jgi:hypothetical protein